MDEATAAAEPVRGAGVPYNIEDALVSLALFVILRLRIAYAETADAYFSEAMLVTLSPVPR